MSTALSEVAKAFNKKAFTKPVFSGRFFMHPTLDQEKTDRYRVNVYTSKLFIEIKTQGRKNTTTRQASKEDKEMFFEALEAFEKDQTNSGIPLRSLSGWTTDNESTLNTLDIMSVENLVEYDGILPWYELRVMRDSAIYLTDCLLKYSPPSKMENEDVRPKSIPVHRALEASRNGQDVRGSSHQQAQVGGEAAQRIGVYLNEGGEIEKTEGFQERLIQEEKPEKVKLDLVF